MAEESNDRPKISALVLAGGRGRRMQGRDKGLISLWGKPMIEHVLSRVTDQVDSTVISANRNSEIYTQYGHPVLADDIGKEWGPLAGIYTALNFVDCDYLLVVPCDTPCLPRDLSQKMLQAVEDGSDIAIANDGERAHFTIALMRCSLAGGLLNYLESGERRVESWIRQHRVLEVMFSEAPDAFVNVNSSVDLESLENKGGC